MTPSTRSAFSRRYVKSGRTRSTPGMSGSGNMIPTSSTRIRPSTSMQAQLRPLSPMPPRKTTRTEEWAPVGVRLAVLAAGLAEARAFVAPVAFEALVEPVTAAFGAASAPVPGDFALRRRPDGRGDRFDQGL